MRLAFRPRTGWLRGQAAAVALLASSTLFALSAPATAQVAAPSARATVPVATPPTSAASSRAYFPVTGFRVSTPAFLSYFQQGGGVRTFGYAISNDFQLLGTRAQIFQRGVLQTRPDGTVGTFNLLADDVLPLAGASGATFPLADPDLVATSPTPNSDAYVDQALSFAAANIPDMWNDQPVSFLSTFQGTVTCDDLGRGETCDERTLASRALDIWGLPTSQPAVDPDHPGVVYQRFERGILQYSGTTGVTQWLLLGELFGRVLSGTNLPSDVQAQMADSRFYAQYDPTSPAGVARPLELPDTILSNAFTPQPAQASGGPLPTGARPTPIARAEATRSRDGLGGPLTSGLGQLSSDDPSATPQPAAATQPVSGLPAAGLASNLPSPSQAGSFGRAIGSVVQPRPVTDAADPDPPVVIAGPTSGPSPATGAATGPTPATTPTGPDPCAGDEQLMFAPLKPYVGTDVLVAATSAKHHDLRTVRLTGPMKAGPVNERPGLNGWVWEWTITPAIEGWHEFTFYVDDARACATAGFNVVPTFGAVPTPMPQAASLAEPTPFSTPTALPTPTLTPVLAPSLAATPAEPTCGAFPGQLLRLSGANFGASRSVSNGNVLFAGAGGTHVSSSLSWTNAAILVVIPTGLATGVYQLVVTTSAGASAPVAYHVGSC